MLPAQWAINTALHGDPNPALGRREVTHGAAQGSELACLMPAGQSLRGVGSHGQETGSWAYLIAAHQEKEMGGMLLDPDDQSANKEEAVT